MRELPRSTLLQVKGWRVAAKSFALVMTLSLAAVACSVQQPQGDQPQPAPRTLSSSNQPPDTRTPSGSTSQPSPAESSGKDQDDNFAGILPLLPDPLLAYTDQDVDFSIALLQAEHILTDRCLNKFGFDYLTPNPDPLSLRQQHQEGLSRLYGPTDPKVAAVYGSLPAPSGLNYERSEQPSDAYIFVLTGLRPSDEPSLENLRKSPGELNRLTIPAGGCLGQARQTLSGDPALQLPNFGNELRIDTFYKALARPDSTKVVGEWRSCMQRAGFPDRDSPLDNNASTEGQDDQRGIQPASAKGIAEAQADITCKKDVNLVPRLNKIHVDLADKVIDENAVVLFPMKAQLDAIVEKANQIISRR